MNYGGATFIGSANTFDSPIAFQQGNYGRLHNANFAETPTTLLQGNRKGWNDFVACSEAPTNLVTFTGTGAGPVQKGFSFPLAINHTGSGVETFDLFELPDLGLVLGQLTLQFSETSNNLCYSAHFKWDGTTLTVISEVDSRRGTYVAGTTIVNNAGQLAIQIGNSSTANNDTKAELVFDGVYYKRQS
jgi:hypothetical protein